MGPHERSPLKQPGVPSKETAAAHALRIVRTRTAYASMSRRGGSLHGGLRLTTSAGPPKESGPPGPVHTKRLYAKGNDPRSRRDDPDSPKSRQSGAAWHPKRDETHSKEIRAALAYARSEGTDSESGTESGESDDSRRGKIKVKKTRAVRVPTLGAFADDDVTPVTPSKAWFNRGDKSRFAEDLRAVRNARIITRDLSLNDPAAFARDRVASAAAAAKTAKRAAELDADKTEELVTAMLTRARRELELGGDDRGLSFQEAPHSVPLNAHTGNSRGNVHGGSRVGTPNARASAGTGDAASALVATRDALNAAAAANATLAAAAKRTPFGVTKTAPMTETSEHRAAKMTSTRSLEKTSPEPEVNPERDDVFSFDFSRSTSLAMESGRARRAKALEQYAAVRLRCLATAEVTAFATKTNDQNKRTPRNESERFGNFPSQRGSRRVPQRES
jgi:hypothetical protein